MRSAALLAAMVAALWLTLPAFVSSASVRATIRAEDSLQVTWLGGDAEGRILLRTLTWMGHAAEASEDVIPARPVPVDELSLRMTDAVDAVLAIPYIQAIRALGSLAVYRTAVLAEWLALGLPLLVAALIDGALMRTVATRSFAHLSPVLFGLGLHGASVVAVCTAVALLLPIVFHPIFWGVLCALWTAALRTAVANFHRLR